MSRSCLTVSIRTSPPMTRTPTRTRPSGTPRHRRSSGSTVTVSMPRPRKWHCRATLRACSSPVTASWRSSATSTAAARTDANNVHSLSKSILSVLTGIAIADGMLALDTEIGELLPADLVGDHGELTVRHLLEMSGGLSLRDDEADYESPPSRPAQTPFVQAVLTRPSVAPAGDEFAYSTGLTQVLAAAVSEAVDKSLCAFAGDRLFGPLDIDVEHWQVDMSGYFSGGHSLFLTPREIARFGQLVLQNGEWNGKQLVPAGWLEQSLAQRWDLVCRRNPPVRVGYGMLWWRYQIGGHQVWEASGAGSQDLAIIPDLDLVVVVSHDTSQTSGDERIPAGRLLYHLLFEAVNGQEQPTPDAACADQSFEAYTMRSDGSARHPAHRVAVRCTTDVVVTRRLAPRGVDRGTELGDLHRHPRRIQCSSHHHRQCVGRHARLVTRRYGAGVLPRRTLRQRPVSSER